jgi:hypothetical protein
LSGKKIRVLLNTVTKEINKKEINAVGEFQNFKDLKNLSDLKGKSK